MVSERAKFWVLVSAKGGVGKSVTCVHMGYAAAQSGRRVLLLDTDIGLGNLHLLAGVQPKDRLERIMAGACGVDEAITPLARGLDLIAADSGHTLSLLADGEVNQELEEALGELATRYDLIIIDTPRGLSDTAIQFCHACHRTVLLTTSEPTAWANSYAWYKMLMLEHPDLPVWLVANRTSSPDALRAFRRLCTQQIGCAPYWGGVVPEDRLVARAVELQRPLFRLEPASPAWRATERLVERLQATENPCVDEADAVTGR